MLSLILFLVPTVSTVAYSVVRKNVTTQFGVISGRTLLSGASEFLGIPFAVPPIKELRWAPTKDWVQPYDDGVFDAVYQSKQCPQSSSPIIHESDEDESCLFLNIWLPPSVQKPLPVLVFAYGGSFVIGSNSQPTYNGSVIATAHGAILVTINYRLGALGWLAAFPASDPQDYNGNWGLLDQASALRWVKQNIGRFGGNPNHVLFFGESAGAHSVCAHLVAPSSRGLFDRALMQSVHCEALSSQKAAHVQSAFSKKIGCSSGDIGCLRGKNVTEILQVQASVSGHWWPTVDGAFMTEQPWDLVKKGNINAVPIALGSNSDEGTLFTFPEFKQVMSATNYKQAVGDYLRAMGEFYPGLPEHIEAVLEMYPPLPNNSSDHRSLYAVFLGDARFVCRTRAIAAGLSPKTPTFLYHFAHACTPGPEIQGHGLGVYHGAELPYVFDNNFDSSYGCNATQADRRLMFLTSQLWADFAEDGAGIQDRWPLYHPGTGNHNDIALLLDFAHQYEGSFSVEYGRRKQYCDFLDTIFNKSPDVMIPHGGPENGMILV